MRGFTYRYMKKEGVVLLVCLWGWEFYSILFKHLKERGVCMKQGMKSILVVAVVLSISRGSYAAEYPHYYELPGVVITATRTKNTIEKVPASMQVITEADIRRSGAHSMRNLLTDFANIFQKSKVRGGGHDIIIRGMSTDKSLIMINGRRVANEADASGLGNAMALDRINLSNVERVEIVRGPSSALYGSEAMGGVINIITRPSMKISLVTGLEQTSNDTSHWWHADTGRIGKFSSTFDMRFNKIRRDMEPEATESNSYGTAQTYNASLNYYFNNNNYINVWVDYYSQNLESDSGNPMLREFPVYMGMKKLSGQAMISGDGMKRYKQQNYGISWNGKTDRNDWQLRAYMSKFDWDSKRNQKVIKAIPGADRLSKMAYGAVLKKQYNTYDFNYNFHNIWAIDGRNTISLNENHRLTFGSEYVRENISGTDLGVNGDGISELTENGITKNRSRKSFSTYAGYIQNEMEYGKWFIVPAIRYDHHSIYGSHASPKLGVTYSANENFRVKANYGKGFKAPTVFQLFYDLDRMMGTTWVHLTGNSNLKPEESTSWDLGIEAKFGKGYGSITYFDSDVDNLINSRFVKIENNGHRLYRYENVNTARIKGVESTLGYKFNDVLEFKVTSTWLNAKDTTKHIDLTQRAKLSQVYQFIYDDHKDKGWSAMLWNQFDYKFVTDANGDGMPDDKKSYSLTSFALTRKINKDTRIYGTVQNVFGKKDTNCDLDGRFWSIGWEHTF